MSYVDGFILPLPKKNIAAYKRMSKQAARVWMEHGALAYVEAVGDDVPGGKHTSFAKSVKLKSGEVPVFAYAMYKSRGHRDKVMKKVMADPRMQTDPKKLPFDGMRMFWGGFKTIVEID